MSNPSLCDDKHSAGRPAGVCDLCGLPVKHGKVTAVFDKTPYCFCCLGCRQVFAILLEAADAPGPEGFRQTELFRQCRAAGIIPASEADLASRADDGGGDRRPPAAAPADVLGLELRVNNMWCPACAWLIEKTLEKNPGIIFAACNFSTDRLHVRYDPVATSPEQIVRATAAIGYRAEIPTPSSNEHQRKRQLLRLAVAAFLTVNVMMLSWALYAGFFTALTADTIHKLSWPVFVMATVVLAYGGGEMLRKAWSGLTHAAFSMETLVIIGAVSAYLYSTVNLLGGSLHLYYDTACMLITLVLLGKTLEQGAKTRVLQGLEYFFSLQPTKVKVLSGQYPRGRWTAIEQLAAGDMFRVEENEIVPADGRIVDGAGAVDESSLTGEPRPVTCGPGDRLRSGSRVTRGAFTVRAQKTAADSTLGQMTAVIQKSLLSKTGLEGKTDIILQWFVPAVVTLAAAVALICRLTGIPTGQSMLRAVTVLVISCPCALGIAIPLARAAGISIAGKKGILVRNFAAFEQARRIDVVVFDKTGTVTEGKWELLEIIPAPPWTADQALALAAGLEKDCEHFLAREILRRAQQRSLPPVPVEGLQVHENGRAGKAGGRKVKIGSAEFVAPEFERMDVLPAQRPAGRQNRHSRVYLAVGGQPAAVFVFGDRLQADARATVEALKTRGYRLALVSGDGSDSTRAVGAQIGIAESRGGCLPQQKSTFVKNLQHRGLQVAMLGDGINDAPALAQADLSIAVHGSGPLGKEAADISLMRGRPGQLIDFLELAEQVNRKIQQNLVFSFLYNAISIPIAAAGLLNPLVAVSAMLLSSLSVTGNTLLLVRKNT